MKSENDRLQAEEDASSVSRDYQRAAEIKTVRLRKEEEFKTRRDKWESEHKLDEVVDVNDIAEVVHQWTGIPLKVMDACRISPGKARHGLHVLPIGNRDELALARAILAEQLHG